MYKKISGLVVSLTAVFACAAWAEVPAGYPADYQKTIDAAVKEGKVVIYSTTDTKAAGPLIKGFEAQYPGVKVEYNDMNSVAVGIPVTGYPPHRSRRARFTHRAP
ncbi:hypothetical protein OPU82_03355, partial [Klebsiella pneumoniae]|nr:hypothetical protein [Klebsiella pneumoniae]